MERLHSRGRRELPGLRYGWIPWLALLVLGAVGVVQRLGWGHAWANYGSYVTWGLWVSAYIYFIGLSAGAFLLASLVYVFRVRLLERVGPIALVLAVVTLLMALLSIWFDLGHMERFYYVFTRPNFRSMMAWMVWLYTAYFLLLVGELRLALRGAPTEVVSEPLFTPSEIRRLWRPVLVMATIAGIVLFPVWVTQSGLWTKFPGGAWVWELWRHFGTQDGFYAALFGLMVVAVVMVLRRLPASRALRILGVLGIPLAVAFHGGVGALFATVAARPYWHSPIYPVLFLTGALVSGGGLLMAVVAFLYPMPQGEREPVLRLLGRIVGILLMFDLLLEWSEFSVPLWYGFGEEVENLKLVLFGPYWWVFWVVHLLVGSLIPLVLIFGGRKTWHWGMAGFLIAATFMAVRLNIVIPGLVTPPLRGLQEAFVDRRLQFAYVPSLHEWLVVLFIVALGAALFYGALRLLYRWEAARTRPEEVPEEV